MKELKAEELRIGNLVRCFNPNKPGMPHDLIATISWKHLRNITEENCPPSYSGIPLTSEWLIRAGFTQEGGVFSPPQELKKMCEGDIGLRWSSFFFNTRLNRWMDCQTRRCVDNVHQLQNHVFALTGTELTFKPIQP